MKTIEDLRSFAKLNLSPSCFRNYEMFIEPTIKDWLFNPIDDWREVESNITQMVMITEKVFKGKINFLSLDEGGSYLFRWDKIPVRDNWRLIKFLKRNYSIDWVKTAKIEKIKGAKTIKLSTEKNSLSLTLKDENIRISLKIDDGRTDEFNVKTAGKYTAIYKEDMEGSNLAFGEEIDMEFFQDIKFRNFTDKIDDLYTKGILKDYSHRVLDEANEVRNKIHNPSIVATFSEQDLTLFKIAKTVTDHILIATRNDFGETISANIKSNAEKFAEEFLLKLNYDPVNENCQ